jgi:hypothetical protein
MKTKKKYTGMDLKIIQLPNEIESVRTFTSARIKTGKCKKENL